MKGFAIMIAALLASATLCQGKSLGSLMPSKSARTLALVLIATATLFAPAAQASKGYSVLYNFCQTGSCTDGANPTSSLVTDSSGDLFGTTWYGGNVNKCGAGCGTVFEVSPSGTETVLYSFCSLTNCADGSAPVASLLRDESGNLYGTTLSGGANGKGTVFKLSTSGIETVLYSFCNQSGCLDGQDPAAGLIADRDGHFYGITEGGGNGFDSCGVIFKLDSSGNETVLYNLNITSDGCGSKANLLRDNRGNLERHLLRAPAGAAPSSN